MLDDNWERHKFDDGTEQFRYYPRGPLGNVFIERVVRPGSLRDQWHIVDRRPPEKYQATMYPPIIAGPFDSIEQAVTAFLMRDRTDQFDITDS